MSRRAGPESIRSANLAQIVRTRLVTVYSINGRVTVSVHIRPRKRTSYSAEITTTSGYERITKSLQDVIALVSED